jgi:transglutaminase-like putative cysteine protease
VLFLLIPSTQVATFEKSNDAPVIRSSLILCTKVLGYSNYVPVKVNFFKPKDNVVLYNEINIARKTGKGLTLNLTWHLIILNPFNFTVYDASTHAWYNNSEASTCCYWYYFTWNVTQNSLDGPYVAILNVSESISKQVVIQKALFNVYGGLSKTLRYYINYTIVFRNPKSYGTATVRRLYIAKIPDVKGYQRVLSGPNYTILPSGFIQDQFGNKYAVFNKFLVGANRTFCLTSSYIVEVNVSYVRYLDAPISKINRVAMSIFINPQKYIESDALEIVSLAKILSGNETNVFNIGKAIFDYTSTNITYDDYWLKNEGGRWQEEKEGALWTYRNKRGLCRHFSALYVAIARALGIPSVVASGYGFLNIDFGKLHSEVGTGHAWVLLFLPGYGWMPVEPQDGWWGQYGASLPTHIMFVEGYFSKFHTSEGDAWVDKLNYWSDSELDVTKAFSYIVEPQRPKRENISITVNTTNKVYAGENLRIQCSLSKSINGLAMFSVISPLGKVYQSYGKFEKGSTFFEWKIPADWKSVGKWNVDVAFPGDESYEWCLENTTFEVLSFPSDISLYTYPENPIENQPITIQGRLNPPIPGENLTITLLDPIGRQHFYYTKTNEDGRFNLNLSSGVFPSGKWIVNISWPGGARELLYNPASNSTAVEVQVGMLSVVLELAFLLALALILILFTRHIIKLILGI